MLVLLDPKSYEVSSVEQAQTPLSILLPEFEYQPTQEDH